MNRTRTSILIDGEFYRKNHKHTTLACPKPDDVASFIKQTIGKVNNHLKTSDHNSYCSLLRTYFFDAKPYWGTQVMPDGSDIDFSLDVKFQTASEFLHNIEDVPQLTLVLGITIFNGWVYNEYNPSKPTPHFIQKEVDMKLGLQMVSLAQKRLVDSIILVAGDSDFIEPVRMAQEEGVHVYLEAMGYPKVRRALKQRVDFNL